MKEHLMPLITAMQLNEVEQNILLNAFQYKKYAKGEYILQQGDVCIKSNYVVSGCAKMDYTDPSGHEHIVMFAIKDWWLSDLGSFITQSPADYNIQCLETTEVLQLSVEWQNKLINKLPKFETFFREKLQSALVHAQKRIIINFSHTAKERYILFREQYPDIEQRIPQYMLASYLGVTKEFFSKMKKEL